MRGHEYLNRRSILAAAPGLALLSFASDGNAQRRTETNIISEENATHSAVFADTSRGIAETLDRPVNRFLIRPGVTPVDIERWLGQLDSPPFILGGRAFAAVQRAGVIDTGYVGLTYLSADNPGRFSGVSLELSPEIAFREMRFLSPALTRAQVVVTPGDLEVVARDLRDAADRHGFDLVLSRATSLSEATDTYLAILRYGNPSTDFLWMMGSLDLGSRDTYPELIELAWRQRFPVFASRRGLVDQGVLVGGEPDFFQAGVQLAALSQRPETSERTVVEATQAAKIVLNARVARRLNISISEPLRRHYDLVVADE